MQTHQQHKQFSITSGEEWGVLGHPTFDLLHLYTSLLTELSSDLSVFQPRIYNVHKLQLPYLTMLTVHLSCDTCDLQTQNNAWSYVTQCLS